MTVWWLSDDCLITAWWLPDVEFLEWLVKINWIWGLTSTYRKGSTVSNEKTHWRVRKSLIKIVWNNQKKYGKCLYCVLIQPLLRGRYSKKFVSFLVKMMTSKGHFEINWPFINKFWIPEFDINFNFRCFSTLRC